MSCVSKQFEFYSGEDKTLEMVLKTSDTADGCVEPFDLTGASEISVQIPALPDNLIKLLSLTQVVIDSPILGKIHCDLASSETMLMISGSILVTVTKNAKKTIFLAEASVKKNVLADA